MKTKAAIGKANNKQLPWMEKLEMIQGSVYEPGIEYHRNYFGFSTLEEAAKDVFMVTIANLKEKAKAQKLGLI